MCGMCDLNLDLLLVPIRPLTYLNQKYNYPRYVRLQVPVHTQNIYLSTRFAVAPLNFTISPVNERPLPRHSDTLHDFSLEFVFTYHVRVANLNRKWNYVRTTDLSPAVVSGTAHAGWKPISSMINKNLYILVASFVVIFQCRFDKISLEFYLKRIYKPDCEWYISRAIKV